MSPTFIQLYIVIMSVFWFVFYLYETYRLNDEFMMLVSLLSCQLWIGLSLVVITINSIN